ncbi:MAG: hypothetical protein ACR2HJ_06445 [Fimbriimonadales bacterium]
MPCIQGDYTRGVSVAPHANFRPGNIIVADQRHLIVSNSPETLVPGVQPTLFKCQIPLAQFVSKTFRVYIWHFNKTGATVPISLIASIASTGGFASLTDVVAETYANATENDLPAAGVCLAKVQLYQSFPLFGNQFNVGNAETPIWSSSIDNLRLTAAIVQFAASSFVPQQLRLRIGIGGDWNSPVATMDGHVRGCWPQSEILLPWPESINVDPSLRPVQEKRCGICESDGPEVQSPSGFYDRPSSIAVPESDNPGTWGANGIYRLTAINRNLSLGGTVSILMEARDTLPFAYWGAAKISNPPEFADQGVLPIKFGTLQSAVVLGSVPIAPDSSRDIFVAVANGGAGTLPVNLKAVGMEVLQYP